MKTNRRLFFKSFIIAFVIYIFITAAFFSTTLTKQKKSEKDESVPVYVYAPAVTDKFSTVISISQKAGDIPYAFFLVSFDAPAAQISLTRLFSDTAVEYRGKKMILSECFEKGGIEEAVSAVNAAFSLEISKYIQFTNDSLIAFLNHFESTIVDVPRAVEQIDKNRDIYIKIDGGRQALGSVLLCDYIAVTKWDTPKQTLLESGRAVCEFLSQNGRYIFEKEQSEIENCLLSQTDNNLSVADIERRREMLCYLLENGSVINRNAEGEFKNLNTEFVLSSQSEKMISAIY